MRLVILYHDECEITQKKLFMKHKNKSSFHLNNVSLGNLVVLGKLMAITVQTVHRVEIRVANTDDNDRHWEF